MKVRDHIKTLEYWKKKNMLLDDISFRVRNLLQMWKMLNGNYLVPNLILMNEKTVILAWSWLDFVLRIVVYLDENNEIEMVIQEMLNTDGVSTIEQKDYTLQQLSDRLKVVDLWHSKQ